MTIAEDGGSIGVNDGSSIRVNDCCSIRINDGCSIGINDCGSIGINDGCSNGSILRLSDDSSPGSISKEGGAGRKRIRVVGVRLDCLENQNSILLDNLLDLGIGRQLSNTLHILKGAEDGLALLGLPLLQVLDLVPLPITGEYLILDRLVLVSHLACSEIYFLLLLTLDIIDSFKFSKELIKKTIRSLEQFLEVVNLDPNKAKKSPSFVVDSLIRNRMTMVKMTTTNLSNL